ncbi:YciI family protein [Candidatus Magnetaquicoccus inordinatus]|uniref:YciI family protein n=1 Tax=Candidatus Magnetaquicoccus inordinatus TaxID=2496818 RepID=UPI00102B6C36|nr:YciI family protein [Candidatus Magnetaquicoccus inordinatus]
MYFAIIGEDVPDSLPLRLAVRPAHLQRLEQLNAEGRLLLAGPFPVMHNGELLANYSGSLIVADFASLEACQEWANADPYLSAGVYAQITIKPFKRVLP